MGDIITSNLSSGVLCIVASYLMETFEAKQLAKMTRLLAIIYISTAIVYPVIGFGGNIHELMQKLSDEGMFKTIWHIINAYPTNGVK